MTIENQIIEWARALRVLRGRDSDEAEVQRAALREKIRIVGSTAAFFGGFDGMTQLHDACEAMTGRRNEIGEVLNREWDGIGGWWA